MMPAVELGEIQVFYTLVDEFHLGCTADRLGRAAAAPMRVGLRRGLVSARKG
ncbi:MAG: hypothetical protein LBI49_00540 [Nocardiopsaceae bacterium]|jgi:hypothetical protein|nr:hypothetical protein [Nocardiopsaceae bacterium]